MNDAHENGPAAAEQSEPTLHRLLSGIELLANVSLKLGRQVEELEARQRALWGKLQRNTPVDYEIAVAGTVNAAGQATLVIGSPDIGTYWELKGWTVGGSDVNVSVGTGAVAGLYQSGSSMVTGGLANCFGYAPSLPYQDTYSTRQLVVDDATYVIVTVYGATPGVTVVANVWATVVNKAAAHGDAEIAL